MSGISNLEMPSGWLSLVNGGVGASIAVTDVASAGDLSGVAHYDAANAVYVVNVGSSTAFVRLCGSSENATTACFALGAGIGVLLTFYGMRIPRPTQLSAICAAGESTTLQATPVLLK